MILLSLVCTCVTLPVLIWIGYFQGLLKLYRMMLFSRHILVEVPENIEKYKFMNAEATKCIRL